MTRNETTLGAIGAATPTAALIANRWTEGRGRFPVLDPCDDSLVAEVADGTAALASLAVDAAETAFESWGRASVATRVLFLRNWHAQILDHAEHLARLISREQGKPLSESRAEVAYGASYILWFAEEARRAYGDIIPSPFQGCETFSRPEPVGVVAVITPWNFPLAMIARKLAPALAAGCTVVAKPAEDTPLSALALVALALEAGLPAGVINIVPASRERAPEVVAAWLDDPRVRKISFTGSTAVGRLLAERSARTLKRLSLELGGDAPFVVLADADLDQAVAGLMKAKFRNAGQACIAANRILVQSQVHDAFVERLVVAVEALTVGPARQEAMIGPLIHRRAAENVRSLVRESIDLGAVSQTGADQPELKENFVRPAVLTGVHRGMRLGREEIFGPIAAVQSFETPDDAVALANDTPYGLAAYVFSSDIASAWRVASRLETGMVGLNVGTISTEAAPFGGVKQSGYGREGSRHGLAEYQSLKFLCVDGL